MVDFRGGSVSLLAASTRMCQNPAAGATRKMKRGKKIRRQVEKSWINLHTVYWGENKARGMTSVMSAADVTASKAREKKTQTSSQRWGVSEDANQRRAGRWGEDRRHQRFCHVQRSYLKRANKYRGEWKEEKNRLIKAVMALMSSGSHLCDDMLVVLPEALDGRHVFFFSLFVAPGWQAFSACRAFHPAMRSRGWHHPFTGTTLSGNDWCTSPRQENQHGKHWCYHYQSC